MTKPHDIKAFYPNFFTEALIAYVCLEIVRNWNDSRTRVEAMGFASDDTVREYKADASGRPPIYRDAFAGRWTWRLVNRFFSLPRIKRMAEKRYLRRLGSGDVAYLWPGSSIDLYSQIKSRGNPILVERINTLRSTSRRILDEEFARLGLTPDHNMTDQEVANEAACMDMADFIFTPSPGVTRSLLAAGIPESKFLYTSYGLRASEILPVPESKAQSGPVTAIFVGSIGVRKGIHLLLDAWSRAAIDGRLIVVGRVDAPVRELFQEHLAKDPTIEHRDFVDDLKPIYQNADFFFLPSLEEGSPLVTYLALGASLPSLVSPMGAGGVVEDGKEGLVVDPHDGDALVQALRKMADLPEMRSEMGRLAREKAPEYTWERVAEKRMVALMAKLAGEPVA